MVYPLHLNAVRQSLKNVIDVTVNEEESKSKRVSAKKRYKIEKKVREHSRKIKKAEKAKVQSRSKKSKIITVPGDCPFKETILTEALALRQSIKQSKQLRKEKIKANRKLKKEKALELESKKEDGLVIPSKENEKNLENSSTSIGSAKSEEMTKKESSFEDLVKKAQERGYSFEKVEEQKRKRDPSLKAFYKEFQQVIGDSDVVIEVLDSRDPLGTRSSDAEEAVRSRGNKKLVMVLNKADLVPVQNLQNWIEYLKSSCGCAVLPFKSNTQKQQDRLGSVANINTNVQASMDTKKSIGISDLLGLLGTWSRGAAAGITVGVIGMPNVGKSSLINSLKRSKACNVGAKPGITRSCQLVHLDAKLRLIDSPGIVFAKDNAKATITVETILARVSKVTLMKQYEIPDFGDEEHFLGVIAKKFGQIKKGGIPNTAAAEQKILHDWNTGSIRFFTEPPEVPTSGCVSTSIMSEFSQPFSLENFEPSSSKPDEVIENVDEDVDMEVEDNSTKRVTRSSNLKSVSFAVDIDAKKQKNTESSTLPPPEQKATLHGLLSVKRPLLKKLRKTKKKTYNKTSDLAKMIDDFNF